MRAFLKSVLTSLFTALTALPALAACEGGDLIAQMNASDRAALYEMTNASPFPEGNLWRAEKGSSTLTIVGTFHLSDPRMDAMMRQISPLLAISDGLFVEATLEDTAELQHRMASDTSLMLIGEGPGLIERLPEETWQQLKTALEERNVPGFMATRMQPWFAGLTLAMAPCVVQQMAVNPVAIEYGLDQRIMEYARDAGIETRHLEEVDDVLNLLAGDPIEQQIEDLKLGMLVYDSNADAQYTTMKHAYFRGEHRLIWEYSMAGARNHPNAPPELDDMLAAFETDLLTNRNLAWMDVLRPAVGNGTYMIAVGAGHLSGETGVLNLLQADGYTLQRLD
ncbi:TraB/GumN family protein [Halocynthiibacter sp.]|uniref:TraB/GumN family protein n=1 Tax=Halocynthiibacter sp. TaxID=1979210 RepID=UPI003C66E6B4